MLVFHHSYSIYVVCPWREKGNKIGVTVFILVYTPFTHIYGFPNYRSEASENTSAVKATY